MGTFFEVMSDEAADEVVQVLTRSAVFRALKQRVMGLTTAREKMFEECFARRPERGSKSLRPLSHRAPYYLTKRCKFKTFIAVERLLSRRESGANVRGVFVSGS
jgi:hypothetical protein